MDEPAVRIIGSRVNASLVKLVPSGKKLLLLIKMGNTRLSVQGLNEDYNVKSYYNDVFGAGVVAMTLDVPGVNGSVADSSVVVSYLVIF